MKGQLYLILTKLLQACRILLIKNVHLKYFEEKISTKFITADNIIEKTDPELLKRLKKDKASLMEFYQLGSNFML